MPDSKRYKDCMEVREDLSAYFDDELSAGERELIDAHLRDCADCLRELDALKRVNDVYERVSGVNTPAGFEDGVRAAMKRGASTVDFPARRVPRWAGPLVAAAAAGVVVLGGVVLLETQQRGEPDAASMPTEMAALERSEADSASGSALRDESGAGSGAWEDFARSPDGARESAGAATDGGAAWKTFVGTEEAPAPVSDRPAADEQLAAGADEFRGRADDSALRQLAASAPPASPGQDADRAAVLGEPNSALPDSRADALKDAAAEAERNESEAKALLQSQADVAQAEGEVARRQTLRSFRVGADGVWYESGYDDQPLTMLSRASDELRELMKRHPEFDWNKIIGRSARQIFQLGGTWYDLESAPESE